ncbi:hypothetical protein EPH95_03685 [Salicibibacter halophilus]|uniref:Uncharacterized protein n=1 Tax=Salicibibacter halophilus TaxID=2502791 RepID=A0A514LEW3_9BACI|nr:hypothetical protein [Salicibibacter halophilus]QDI90392.1 hypothetical protein EPH95_03685 [Salicibibacter halophilus]
MDQNALIMEVLKDMEPKIQKGLQATHPQEREDLKQDMRTRLVKVTSEMERISFWTFKERFYEKGLK